MSYIEFYVIIFNNILCWYADEIGVSNYTK